MLSYELCLKLKEAGFPFDGMHETDWCIKNGCSWNEDWEKTIHNPTLSELIAACGDEFSSLILDDCGENPDCEASKGLPWRASSIYIPFRSKVPEECILVGRGFTPIEAVANLYLALKK